MKVVVVSAHPCDDSFNAAIADAAVTRLRTAGHHVDHLDLYAIGFEPVMPADELVAYRDRRPPVDATLRDHGQLVADAEALVFVYPTWWSGLPAMLKGWLERVMVPGVAFTFDADGKVEPALTNIRHLVGISTYGSPWTYVKLTTDGGRRTIARALRLCCSPRPRVHWIGLYSMDTCGPHERAAFLDRVGHQLGGLR